MSGDIVRAKSAPFVSSQARKLISASLLFLLPKVQALLGTLNAKSALSAEFLPSAQHVRASFARAVKSRQAVPAFHGNAEPCARWANTVRPYISAARGHSPTKIRLQTQSLHRMFSAPCRKMQAPSQLPHTKSPARRICPTSGACHEAGEKFGGQGRFLVTFCRS